MASHNLPICHHHISSFMAKQEFFMVDYVLPLKLYFTARRASICIIIYTISIAVTFISTFLCIIILWMSSGCILLLFFKDMEQGHPSDLREQLDEASVRHAEMCKEIENDSKLYQDTQRHLKELEQR